MLNQKDIDQIHKRLDNGEEVFLYYVAHNVELREEAKDEHIYKSKSDFRVIKIKITDVYNAWNEYMNFINNPDEYHEEIEEEYYSSGRHLVGDFTSYPAYEKYIHYYIVKNEENNNKAFNSRFPSIIYGHRRKIYKRDGSIIMQNDPTIMDLNYTNNPSYYGVNEQEVINLINNGSLSWKYNKVDNNSLLETDGIEYRYTTTDWYIFEIDNFPRTEKPLINVNQQCAYFLDINSAFEYLYQLRS